MERDANSERQAAPPWLLGQRLDAATSLAGLLRLAERDPWLPETAEPVAARHRHRLVRRLIVAVVGSRDYPNLERVKQYVTKLAVKYPDAVLISGGARGVDQMAEKVALWSGLDLISYRPYGFESMEGGEVFSIEAVTQGKLAQTIVVEKNRRINPPTFSTYGACAMFRNSWIVQDAEVVVAFHHNNSAGTARSIRVGIEFGRQVFVYQEKFRAQAS